MQKSADSDAYGGDFAERCRWAHMHRGVEGNTFYTVCIYTYLCVGVGELSASRNIDGIIGFV